MYWLVAVVQIRVRGERLESATKRYAILITAYRSSSKSKIPRQSDRFSRQPAIQEWVWFRQALSFVQTALGFFTQMLSLICFRNLLL